MPEEATLRLAAASQRVEARPKAYLWFPGEPPKFFAVIVSGVVRLMQATPTGRQVAVELVGRGDCSGLLATLGRTPHPFSAMALTDVVYVAVPSPVWWELGTEHPLILQNAVERVVPRMLGGFGFMAHMAAGDVESRLATALLRMDQLASRETDASSSLPITRQGLAEIVGTTVESAIRVTSKWTKAGWVEGRHGRIVLRDRRRLQELSGNVASSSVQSSGVLPPVSQSGSRETPRSAVSSA